MPVKAQVQQGLVIRQMGKSGAITLPPSAGQKPLQQMFNTYKGNAIVFEKKPLVTIF